MASAILWFLGKFNVNLLDAVLHFKYARVMCPVTVWWLRPTRATVEAVRIFPFLDNDATIGGLVIGLPQYITATQDVVIECEGKKVEWWKLLGEGLPNWSSDVKKAVQPSVAAERVFSLPRLHLSMTLKIMHSRPTYKMSGFYVTSPRLPFTRPLSKSNENNKFTENYGLKQTLKRVCCFIQYQT